jgi:hypothetical protein
MENLGRTADYLQNARVKIAVPWFRIHACFLRYA